MEPIYMLFFLSDWQKFPTAIRHDSTKNTSWVRMAVMYRDVFKLANWEFCLALIDPDLEFVDPHDANLSTDMKMKIRRECARNPWYYFREVFKVPARSGVGNNMYRANRHVLATIFLFFNHIDTASVIMRQVGKSLLGYGLKSYLLTIGMQNSRLLWMTTTNAKRVETVEAVKDILKELPPYIYHFDKKRDKDNSQDVTCSMMNNQITYAVGQASKKIAELNGRGFSLAVKFFDEIAEAINGHIIQSASSGASGAVIDEAREKNEPYADMLMCTAGDLGREEGRAYYKYLASSAVWTEMFFDSLNEPDLKEMVLSNIPGGGIIASVNLTFSWRQLGISEQRYKEIRAKSLKDSGGDEERARREVDSIWSMGGSSNALTPDQANVVFKSEADPIWTELYANRFIIRWYVSKDELRTLLNERRVIIGMDTSKGVGRDACSVTVMDAATGAVLGRADVNTINLTIYGGFAVYLLKLLHTAVLIIENKSSGQGIIDAIIVALTSAGEDVIKRVYNLMVQDPDKYPMFNTSLSSTPVLRRCVAFYEAMAGNLGFPTNKGLRQELFVQSLREGIRCSGSVIRDKTLSLQMRSLINNNGRIDHPSGGHDDAVISYLLCIWFTIFARNISRYGLDKRMPLSLTMRTDDGSHTKEDLERYGKIKWIENRVQVLEGEWQDNRETYYGSIIKDKLRRLHEELEKLGIEPRNWAQALEELGKQNSRHRRHQTIALIPNEELL
jgi:hypothetical protein